ncbi:hypothetical protein K443DRAFT_480713 [Laccaria amethystina LaAM-08-1]|uniref:Uncharacterized protein n=1 Tax=Laccaria amethystina LaAM-08-1 TaxID=1095629 RepID=A0A0C9Y050_9AGAR|nr:hypothetical protein K443DRAFT_480713 [Laccaria amethystina LaAM-08-1]
MCHFLAILGDERSNSYFAEGISRDILFGRGRRCGIFFATRPTAQEGRCISFLDYPALLSFLCVHFCCSNYTNVILILTLSHCTGSIIVIHHAHCNLLLILAPANFFMLIQVFGFHSSPFQTSQAASHRF